MRYAGSVPRLLTRPDKLLWPAEGVTKRLYLEYLDAVSGHMLPWLRDRPLTLVRAPDGVGEHRYFQKDTPGYAPDWIRTVPIHAESAKRTVRYVLCNDWRTLAWLGNQAAVEFHPSPIRAPRLDRPDVLIFDLDPPPGAFSAVVDVAVVPHEVLDEVHLPSGVKTSGSKGLHVVVPLQRRFTQDQVRRAAERIAAAVVGRAPELATTEFRIADRGGRVLVDIWRNAPSQTAVAPYSPRALPEATVSFPLTWPELPDTRISDFRIRNVPALLDLPGPSAWRVLLTQRARLPMSLIEA
jgi:bifunctional non-homologous end joining protein LigD